MNLISAVSIITCCVYLYIGFYVFSMEKRSKINKLFMLLCIGMAIWSFAYAFVYVTNEKQYIWMKISAIGWCTFSSFVLHLVLLFTENKLGKKKIVEVLLYFPSALFFYISVFLYRKNSLPPKFVQDFFNIGDFIYHFSFLLTSIILIVIWGMKANNIRKIKQAKILVVTSFTPFLLNLLTQTILPAMGITILPLMGHIYGIIMVIGVYYALIKYSLFIITPKLLVDEILHEMMDLVVLISPDGKIIKVNNSITKLLGYSNNELLNKTLDSIIRQESVLNIMNNTRHSEIYRLYNVNCIRKDGYSLPVNIACSPIIDPVIRDTLGVVIVGQDISIVKKLEEEIEGHKKAEEYIKYMANHDSLTGLPNRKYFYQKLEQALDKGKRTNEKFAVFFLDLDDLKLTNDTYGHEAGDQLLWEVGFRAKSIINKEDVIARIGGDEFTFLIFGIKSIEEAREVANNIIKTINKPISIYGKELNVSSSIGVSIFPEDGYDLGQLIKKADDEMYMIKKRKKALQH